MKMELNKAISSISKIGEVLLFREMASIFNSGSTKCTYVHEVHSHNGFVDYDSRRTGKRKKIEIADLLIINYNTVTKETRLSFLQAKYKKEPYSNFITFHGNAFQWELLHDRCDIIDTYKKGFDPHILNFNPQYKTISSFGLSYKDTAGKIDFLFTIPEHIHISRFSVNTTMRFHAPCCICPNNTCIRVFFPDETISTCNLDIFESEILKGRIGAPITPNIRGFVRRLLFSIRRNNTGNDEIRQIIGQMLENNDMRSEEFEKEPPINYPSVLLLITKEGYRKT